MTEHSNALFDAFHADHAVLGRGFYRLGECLRAGDAAGARAVAKRIDGEAGPHIAFEEHDFYPALKAFLDPGEVNDMYREHREGRALLQEVLALPDGALGDKAYRQLLVDKLETMQTHIADCGTLFGAMGGITPEAQAELLQRLQTWRDKAPQWLALPTTAKPGLAGLGSG